MEFKLKEESRTRGSSGFPIISWDVVGEDGITLKYDGEGERGYLYDKDDNRLWDKTKDNLEDIEEVIKEYRDICYEAKVLLDNLDLLPDYIMNNIYRTEPITFTDADIIITDPCYVLNWDNYMSGKKPKDIGEFISTGTTFGDGSWHTFDRHIDYKDYQKLFDKETGKPFKDFEKSDLIDGNPCADAGMMGVFDLHKLIESDQVAEPEKIMGIVGKNWTRSIIRNFTGTVEVVKQEIGYIDFGRTHIVGIKGTGNINFMVWLD